MEQYSDIDLLYLALKFICTPEGLLITIFLITILFWALAFLIGAFRTVAEIDTNNNQTHNTN
jgi:hypothetical protein